MGESSIRATIEDESKSFALLSNHHAAKADFLPVK
jgi:hypothetical protein